jgi:hypothetical protein
LIIISTILQCPKHEDKSNVLKLSFEEEEESQLGVIVAIDGSHMTFHPKKENMKSFKN